MFFQKAFIVALLISALPAQEKNAAPLSEQFGFTHLFNGKDLTNWVDVNTSPETWSVKDGLLVCSGKPIGVMRSERQYENFILVIEWRHMEGRRKLWGLPLERCQAIRKPASKRHGGSNAGTGMA